MEPPTKRLKIGQAPYEDDQEENEDELAMTPFQFDTQQDPMYQLDKGRAKAATRLKSTFEHIFEKYEKDFTGVGDEIDLETGEIVVNNGHLESLREPKEDGSTSSDEEESILRGKSSHNGSQSQPAMKAPSSSSNSLGQASLDPWDEPFAANHRLSNLAMAPSPFGTPPPFSFGSSFASGDPADPAWQAPDIPISLFQDSFGFRNHFMGYPGTIEYNSLGQPRIRNSYRDVFGHQPQKRFTCAKAFTRKPLPAPAPADTTDAEEDDILLGRPLPDPEPEQAKNAATPAVNTLEAETGPEPAPHPVPETRGDTAGDKDSAIERPPRKRGRLRRATTADETLNPNCQVVEDTQTAEDDTLLGRPLADPGPESAENVAAPTLDTEHPPKPAAEPAAEPSPESIPEFVPKAAPEPIPEIGGDTVGDKDSATEGLPRKRGRPRKTTTANKYLNSNNQIEPLSDAEPEPAGKVATTAVNTLGIEHDIEPAAEPVPEPAPETGAATAGDEDSTTEWPRRKRGRPRRATTTDEIINANCQAEESQATLAVASTQMPGDTDTPETRTNDLSEPQLPEEGSHSAEKPSSTKVDQSDRTTDDDEHLDMSHRRSTRVRKPTDFYGTMVLSTLSRRRRKSHGATAVADDAVEKEVDQPQLLAQESSQALPEPTVPEPTLSKKGQSEGAADGSRQVETAPINDMEPTRKPKLDERIPIQAFEVLNPSISDDITVEENHGESQVSTQIPRDNGAITVDDGQDPNYSVMDVDKHKTGSQDVESRPTEATWRDEIGLHHASVAKEGGELAEKPSSPIEPATCDVVGNHADSQLDPADPTGTAQSPGDQEDPKENVDDRLIIQQLESQNTPGSEPTEETTERPTEIEPNERGSSTEGPAQAPPKAETVRVLRSRKQIPVGSAGLPTLPSQKFSDGTEVRDAIAENPTEAVAVPESTEHATPKRNRHDLAIRASSKPSTKELTPISDRERPAESDAAPGNPPITHQSDRGPTAAAQQHESPNPETPKRTPRAAIRTTSTATGGKIRSGGRWKSKAHSTTTATRRLTPSDKRFALSSLVPDDPEYEDELSTLSSALTTPTASKSATPLSSSSSLFGVGVGRANPDIHLLSATSTPRGPPGPKHNGAIGHRLGAKTPTNRLFDRTRRQGSLAPATDPRAYYHRRRQLGRNPSFSGSSPRRKLTGAGAGEGSGVVHSSPLARTMVGRAAGGASTGTTTGGEDEEDEQGEDVVQTPGGAAGRCGMDGFVCERDFCFTCCI
ncbi:hypothetical protein DL764_000224 [Monosporascus ibericus]|uniref:Centromere protein Scm3 n=1 Tax=Monosporascus ibericus TaxID=155417 RepID=A0A4Q4TZR2_9PEZI|nr:hypothetical protein DL764_000224 [Monosporascus ibericus]